MTLSPTNARSLLRSCGWRQWYPRSSWWISPEEPDRRYSLALALSVELSRTEPR